MNFWSRIVSRTKSKHEPHPHPGLNVCLLQKKLQRYSTEQLNAAMQTAWNRPYESLTFFGMSLDNEHGLIKFNDFYIPIFFQDRRLDSGELDGLQLPSWTHHNAFCRISFIPGGEGLPTIEERHRFTGFISLLCLELANEMTTSFYFMEDRVFVAKELLTKDAIFKCSSFDPRLVAST
jgi:hypothetical protein